MSLGRTEQAEYKSSVDDASLGGGLRWSVAGHLILIAIIVLRSLVFPEKPITYVPALRVDIVGLPQHLKKDRDKIKISKKKEPKKDKKQKTKNKISKAKPKKDVLALRKKKKQNSSKKRKEKMSNALARIKALSKLDQAEETPEVLTEVRGNRISKGTSLSPEARERSASLYFDSVLDRIKNNWTLPVWIARQELSAQITLYIGDSGEVRGTHFKKRSGNEKFDEAVEKAISKSEPFDPPPEELAGNVLSNGILLGFPL